MKSFVSSLVVLMMGTVAFGSPIYELAMDQQVDHGWGEVIVDSIGRYMSFEPDPGDGLGGFTRCYIPQGYYSGPTVYFDRDLGAPLDLSGPLTIEFDIRVYNDEELNEHPYEDANGFVYFKDVDGNNYGLTMLYQTNSDWGPAHPQFPEWYHVVAQMNLSDLGAGEYPTSAQFDATQVTRIIFRGTDWYTDAELGADFVDLRNLVITPEPASLALLVLGGLAVLRRRS